MYVRKQIVHNIHVVSELESRGAMLAVSLAVYAVARLADVRLLGEEGEQVVRRRRPERLARLEGKLEGGSLQVCEEDVEVVRVEPRLLTLGIARAVPRGAVAEAFGDVDEGALIERAIDRRLRRGESLEDPAVRARVYRFLLGQGFDGDRVAGALRRRGSRETL